jgi:DNA-binding transcriptional LysR family regulator
MFHLTNMKNLVALDIFVSVGKLRNFTKAADQLGLTKSTVSRQIQSLEKELGVTLIKRDPRHFSLTDEGSAFLRRAESIIGQTKEAFEEVSQIQSSLRGSINIATTADLSLVYLARPVAEFSIRHPEIEFSIDLSPRQVDLKSDGFDMAIRPGNLKDSGLYARKIDEQQPNFYASPEYLEMKGRPRNLSDLRNHAIIATSKMDADGVAISPSIKANNMSLVKQLTLRGAGIGVFGEKMARDEKREGSLIQVLPNFNLPKVPIYLLFPHKKMPKRISAFAQEILERKF